MWDWRPLPFLFHYSLHPTWRLISQNPFPNASTLNVLVAQCARHSAIPIRSFIKCHFSILHWEVWTILQKITQALLVKPESSSFPLMPNSVSYFASGFQKYTCNCLPQLPFISFHYCSKYCSIIVHLFSSSCSFSQLITHSLKWPPQITYPPVDC